MATGFKEIFDESKHPRAGDGKFAHTAGLKLVVPKHFAHVVGKTAPHTWKFYKQGYKPKPWSGIKGTNSKSDGLKLWESKKAGHFANDYQFYLAASKLSALYKKSHPNDKDAASHNQIINAAFRHELEDTGDVKLLDVGGSTSVPNKLGPDLPPKPDKHVHGATPGGIPTVSKFAPPGTLTTFVKQMPGATGSKLYKDDKGTEWLVKAPKTGSNAYSNGNFLVDLEHAAALIQNKGGLRSANSHKTTLDGKKVLAQKMFGDVKIAFPNGPNIFTMTNDEKLAMEKNQIFDWMISNHDTHTGNFLKDDKGIVAIDKGQAFKFFGKDKLDWNYAPVSPLGSDKPTYQTMWKDYVSGQGDLLDFNDSPELLTFAERLQNIPDDEYADMLRPYAEQAQKDGKLSLPQGYNSDGDNSVNVFLDLAVARKNNLVKDFTAFYKKADDAKVAHAIGLNESKTIHPGDKPGNVGLKSPGQEVEFSHVEVGDWIQGGIDDEQFEVVGKGTSTLSLDDGSLLAPHNLVHGGWVYANVPPYLSSLSKPDVKPHPKPDSFDEFLDKHPKMAPGYHIKPHPTESTKFAIQKPNGEFSKSADGTVKSWDSPNDALDSSTMAKYKANPMPEASSVSAGHVSLVGIEFDKPENYPGITYDELNQLQDMMTKNTQSPLQGDEYLAYKALAQKIKDSKKAAGAADVIDAKTFLGGFSGSQPIEVEGELNPITSKLPTPSFKKKGGAPPALEKATGPNALKDGKSLWDRKKAGEFNSDDELWKAANKLSNQYKSQAAKDKPGVKLESGVDYSSPNQLRNVAMRLEYDETGDVKWENAASKTSQTEKQSKTGAFQANFLHTHTPVVAASPGQSSNKGSSSVAKLVWSDTSKPVGSYQNPHCFAKTSQGPMNEYGFKYTDHNGWNAQQKDAWYNFSGSYSSIMNGYFRTGEASQYGVGQEQSKKLCQNLVGAFASKNVKPLDDWTVVTRGTNGGWELGIGKDTVSFEELKAQEGQIVRNKCPVSSSMATSPAFSGSMRITYKLPPGFRGIWLGQKSAHSSENEMMLPPGMAYKILKVEPGTDSYKTEVLVEVVDVTLPEVK